MEELAHVTSERLLDESTKLSSRALVRLLRAVADFVEAVAHTKKSETSPLTKINLSETCTRMLASKVSYLLDARRFDLPANGQDSLVGAAESMRRLGLVPHLMMDAERNGLRLGLQRHVPVGSSAWKSWEGVNQRGEGEGLRKKTLWGESFEEEEMMGGNESDLLLDVFGGRVELIKRSPLV
eukprot:GDKJ01025786.1.p1 GENE.GDKJ01025786.1~~GDKJ01025786.1.p1  ORF type:complete len:182 (+),score=50.18 GDKJ01025786.1:77-622(+)